MIHKTAVITGASEGIGRSLTKLLVNLGWEVVGISRNKKRLNELDKELSNSNGLFKYYECDVQDFDKLKSIEKKINQPDLLFLNAGVYRPVDASKKNLEKNFNRLLSLYFPNWLFFCCPIPIVGNDFISNCFPRGRKKGVSRSCCFISPSSLSSVFYNGENRKRKNIFLYRLQSIR